MICRGIVGAVVCLEASRLARNGREWHQLLDLCAVCGALVIDHDDVYDPRRSADRLMLGLKGTMSEYELSVLRARAVAARDSKARRGELRMLLPPGYCWNELGRVEIDPDRRVADAVRMVFRKFREEGSARQLVRWLNANQVQLPVRRSGLRGARIEWQHARYGTTICMLRNPRYAGAYVFGRTETRTKIVDGHGRKSAGHIKPREQWDVLIRDAFEGYISWSEFEENQRMLRENAHNQKHVASKPGRGGTALLTGLLRCGRCGRMLRVNYGARANVSHTYYCHGDETRGVARNCMRAAGLRVDRAITAKLLEALAPLAIDAAIEAAERSTRGRSEVRAAIERELEEARYEAQLAERRHAAVDPDKRLVASELEARWEKALERVRSIESRLARADDANAPKPMPSRDELLALASDLTSVWNAETTDARAKQRIARTVIVEVIVDRDRATNEQIVVVHWAGGRHTEIRFARQRVERIRVASSHNAIEVIRALAADHTDREIAMTLTRMRVEHEERRTWTAVRVERVRARLGLAPYDPSAQREEMISLEEAAIRLSLDKETVRRLIREGILPGTQKLPNAPWRIPALALDTDAVKTGRRQAIERRLPNSSRNHDTQTLKLRGI
jgi:hypothetical protein